MTGVVSSSMESMGVNNVAIQVTPRDYTSSYTYTEDDLITDEMIEQYQNKYRNEIVGIGLMLSLIHILLPSQPHPYGKTVFEKAGVRVMSIWWS